MTTYNPTSTHGVHGDNGETVVKESQKGLYFVAESIGIDQKHYIEYIGAFFGTGIMQVRAFHSLLER